MSTVGSGRYSLEERLAGGGMGEVWRGVDTSLRRRVAIKLLHAHLADDPSFRARFESEARNAAALHDSTIATVFDYGVDVEEGTGHRTAYLVMELVEGRPLSDLITGPMPPERVCSLLAQVADGLQVAHNAGIVHRDVKPANFLVTPGGRIKVTDFGIARARGATTLTDTGTIMGTPSYVAPEVAEGHEATPLSDLYSLGVVLYECLTGIPPFRGDTPVAIVLAHLREDPPPLPADVPEHLRELVAALLSKNPAGRPPTASAVASALRSTPSGAAPAGGRTRVLTVALAAAGPTSGRGDPQSRSRRGLWMVVGVAATILAVISLAAALSRSGNDQASRGNGAQSPAGTGTSAEATEPSVSSTDEPVNVDADDYIGMDAKEADRLLKDLGLKVKREKVEGDGEKDTVADVAPTGNLPAGGEITLYSWQGEPRER